MYLTQQSAYPPPDPEQYAPPPMRQQNQYPATSYVNAYPPSQQPYSQQAYPQQVYSNEPIHPSSYTPALSSGLAAQPGYYPANQVDILPHHHHDSNSQANWMAPAVGGAVGGVAAGALASDIYQKKQMEQRELAQQREINEQQNHAQQVAAQQVYEHPHPIDVPIGQPGQVQQQANVPALGTASVISEHVPSDTTPALPIAQTATGHDTVIATHPVHEAQAHPEPVMPAPGSNTDPFLDFSEAGAAITSGKTINGGPVPVELADTADMIISPRVNRQNTDISVSDLHVPGEFPKSRMTEPAFSRTN